MQARFWLRRALAALSITVATALGAQTVELTAASVNPPGEPCFEALKLMSERLAAGKTGVRLKVFPQGQVGDEKDAIEQVKLGAISLTCVSNANVSSFAPSIGVFDIPFLFRDADKHPWIVVDGPIGRKMGADVEKESGLAVLGWWSAGMRHVFTRGKPVRTPADLKDVKIRVIGSPV
jgi:TRAP-type transport system periplasmic protein